MTVKFLPLEAMMKLSRPFTFLKHVPLAGRTFEYLHKKFTPQHVVMNVNGYKMMLDFRSGGVAKELIKKNGYENFTTGIFKDIVSSGKGMVIDIGANIGYYTLLAAKSGKQVIAIEPERNNYLRLEQNLALNGYYAPVLNYALSDHKGTVELYVSDSQIGECNIIGSHDLENHYTVRCETLDNILSPLKPDDIKLIKIDVEGAECLVLKGSGETLRRYSPDIFVECWEEGLLKAGYSIEILLDMLHGYGYGNIKMLDEYQGKALEATPDKIREYSNAHYFSVNLWCRK